MVGKKIDIDIMAIDYLANRRKLYDALAGRFGDLGTFDEFNQKIDDPAKREKLYNAISGSFGDVGDYDSFNAKLGNVVNATDVAGDQASAAQQQVSQMTGTENANTLNTYQPMAGPGGTEQDRQSVQQAQQSTANTGTQQNVGGIPMVGQWPQVQHDFIKEFHDMYALEKEQLEANAEAGMPLSYSEYNDRVNDLSYADNFMQFVVDPDSMTDEEYAAEYAKTNGHAYGMLWGDKVSPATVSINGKGITFEQESELRSLLQGALATYENGDANSYIEAMYKYMERANELLGEGGADKYNAYLQREQANAMEKDVDRKIAEYEKEYEKAEAKKIYLTTKSSLFNYGMVVSYTQCNSGEKVKFDLAKTMMEEAKHHIKEYKLEQENLKGQSEFEQKYLPSATAFWRGVRDKLLDISTWDFGFSDAREFSMLLSAVNKADKDEELTPGETAILDAAATRLAVQVGMELNGSYRSGEVTAEMVPFMIEIAINPLSAVGETVASKVARWGIKKGMGKISRKILSGSARVLTDALVTGPAMSVTTGAFKTMSSIEQREIGNIQFNVDDNGRFYYDGTDGREDATEAVIKGIASQSIEYQSEMVGEYFKPLSRMVGKYAVRAPLYNVLGEEYYKNMYRLMTGVGDGAFTTVVRNTRKTLSTVRDKSKVSGWVGETAEEIVGGLENSMLGTTDQNMIEGDDAVLSWNNISETGLMMLPSQVMFALLPIGMGGVSYGYDRAKAYHREITTNSRASSLLGRDRWAEIKIRVNEAKAEDLIGLVKEITADESMSNRQKVAIAQYVIAMQYRRGADMAKNLARAHSLNEMVYGNSRDLGYNMQDPSDVSDYCVLNYADEQALRNSGIADVDAWIRQIIANPAAAMEKMYRNAKDYNGNVLITDEQLRASENYARSRAVINGAQERISAESLEKRSEFEENVKASTHDDGQLHPVKLRDGSIAYVKRGKIFGNPDGTVDMTNSDAVVPAMIEGKERMVSVKEIATVQMLQDPKFAIEGNNKALEQANKTSWESIANGNVDTSVGADVTLQMSDGSFESFKVVGPGNNPGEFAVESSDGQVFVVTDQIIQMSAQNARMSRVQEMIDKRDGKKAPAVDQQQQAPVDDVQQEDEQQQQQTQMREDPRKSLTWEDEDGNTHTGKGMNDGTGWIITDDATGNVVTIDPDYDVRPYTPQQANAQTENVAAEPAAQEEDLSQPVTFDKDGNPKWSEMSTKRAAKYLASESGLELNDALDFVQKKVEEAKKGKEKWDGKTAEMGTDLAKYQKEKQKIEANRQMYDSMITYWQGVLDGVKEIQQEEYQRMQKSAARDASTAAHQRRSRMTNSRRIADIESMGLSSDSPSNAEEAVLWRIATGNLKLTTESIMSEKGSNHSVRSERWQDKVRTEEKGGMSIQRVAEDIADSSNGLIDEQDARNAINDLISLTREQAIERLEKISGVWAADEQSGQAALDQALAERDRLNRDREMRNRLQETLSNYEVPVMYGDAVENGKIFVIDAYEQGSYVGSRVAYGFRSNAEAEQAYRDSFGDNAVITSVLENPENIERWAMSPNRDSMPFSNFVYGSQEQNADGFLAPEEEAPFSVTEAPPVGSSAEWQDRIKMLEEIYGVNVKFQGGFNAGENGFYDAKSRTIVVSKDIPANRALGWVIGHEMTHHMKSVGGLYGKYAQSVMDYYGADAFFSEVAFRVKLYKEHNKELSMNDAIEEVCADFGGNLLRDGKLVDKFAARQDMNFIQKLYADLMDTINKARKIITEGGLSEMDKAIISMEKFLESSAEAKNEANTISENTDSSFNNDNSQSEGVNNGDVIKYSIVDDSNATAYDRQVMQEIADGNTRTVYRGMQMVEIDGNRYALPPMASKVNGEWVLGIEIREDGTLEPLLLKADEHPELAKNGKFYLDKGNDKGLWASYNPYWHVGQGMLNDQFAEAQDRSNLITVEGIIPISELTSGYKAEKAKDGVGAHEWKAGIIQGQLSGTREVILSRYFQGMRVVPDAEVAKNIFDQINGHVDYMPTNVVPPGIRAELEKLGVKFVATNNKNELLEGEHSGDRYTWWYGNNAEKNRAKKFKESSKEAGMKLSDWMRENGREGQLPAEIVNRADRLFEKNSRKVNEFGIQVENGIVTDADNALKFSITTERGLEQSILQFADSKEANRLGWMKEQVADIVKETSDLIEFIHKGIAGDVNYDDFAKKDPTVRIDWRDGVEKPVVTWVRNNVEYKYDMSADTFCINNEGLETVLASPVMADLMVHMADFGYVPNKEGKTGFDSDDYLRLYETLRDLGFVVPCKGCFDAAARFKMLPSTSQKFVKLVNETIDERNKDPEAFDSKLRELGKKSKETTVNGFPAGADNKELAVKIGVAGDNLTEHIEWTQLMSAEGQTKALSDWGGIFRAWQKTGAGRPKDKLMPEPYTGQIMSTVSTIIAPMGEKTPSFRDLDVNVGTGLRRNSHSEFRPVLAIDEIQFLRDAWLKKLCVFKYMKELDDVRLFGNMGIKFNMSAFAAFHPDGRAAGLDANGDYAFAEESVGGREYEYVGEDGKTHYDGKKGFEEAKKHINKDCSLSSVAFSIPHLIKLLTDVPTPSDKSGTFGSIIPFHASGATTHALRTQGLGVARANGEQGHPFMVEAMTDYDKGVTCFEQVQNDRFGDGWRVLAGKRKGTDVNYGHKIEFANGTIYRNDKLGITYYASVITYEKNGGKKGKYKGVKGPFYTLDSEKEKVAHPLNVDYNDKVRELGGKYAYKEAADFYVDELRKRGFLPRFDFDVPEDLFLKMCSDANVDPNHPKLGWKGEGNSWSPCDAESYYSVFCDYGMTDPATGELSQHRPVLDGQTAPDAFEKALPENYIEVIQDGIRRYSNRMAKEDARINEAIVEYCKRSIEAGKMSKQVAEDILDRHGIKMSITPDVTRTESFKQWFGDWEQDPENASKVVDEDGKPMVVYHGTDNYGFTVFNTASDWNKDNIGSHFGPSDVAEGFTSFDDYYAVYLDIKKPWETFDFFADVNHNAYVEALMDLMNEIGTEEARKMFAEGIKKIFPSIASLNVDRYSFSSLKRFIDDEQEEAENKLHTNSEGKIINDAYDKQRMGLVFLIRDMMKLGGYDGIKYENWYEGKDNPVCWIALEPNQVKSAETEGDMANNGDFDRNNPDIRFSISGSNSRSRDLSYQTEMYNKGRISENNWLEFIYRFNGMYRRMTSDAVSYAYNKYVGAYNSRIDSGEIDGEKMAVYSNETFGKANYQAPLYIPMDTEEGRQYYQDLWNEMRPILDDYVNEVNKMVKNNSWYRLSAALMPRIIQMKERVEYDRWFYEQMANGNDVYKNGRGAMGPFFHRQSDYDLDESQMTDEHVDEVVKDLSERLNTKVSVRHTIDEVKNPYARKEIERNVFSKLNGKSGGYAKAWFDPETGEIEVYSPYAENVDDLTRSVMHEVVGHKGLRDILAGNEQEYRNAMMDIYELLPTSQRRRVIEYAEKNGYDIATATDECLADAAMVESTPAWWQRVASVFRNLLRKVGINVSLSETDIKYMLWRSRKTLENAGKDGFVDMAEESLMRWQNGIGRERKQAPLYETYTPAFRFIGEKGAMAHEGMNDMLECAKDVEKLFTPEQLKSLTGWERGADGKWRYEIVDDFDKAGWLNPMPMIETLEKEIEDLNAQLNKSSSKIKSVRLAMQIDNTRRTIEDIRKKSGNIPMTTVIGEKNPLFEEYPQLSDMSVEFNITENGKVVGEFYAERNKLVINVRSLDNILKSKNVDDIASMRRMWVCRVLAHEIQHAIQSIEGFARGGSPSSIEKMKKDAIDRVGDVTVKSMLSVLTPSDLSLMSNQSIKDTYSIFDEWMKDLDVNDSDPMTKAMVSLLTKQSYMASNGDMKYLDEWNDAMEKALRFSQKWSGSNVELYRRLMGEVEARVTQESYGMTSEQRAQSTSESREDVRRGLQINYNGATAESRFSITPDDRERRRLEAEVRDANREVDRLKREVQRLKGSREKLDEVRAKASEIVNQLLTPEAGQVMTSTQIHTIINTINSATNASDIDKALSNVISTINRSQLKAEMIRMEHYLNTKTQSLNKRGQAKGVFVDSMTAKILESVRGTFKQLVVTNIDAQLKETRGKINKLGSEIASLRESGNTARADELQAEQDALKQERDNLNEVRRSFIESNIEETIENLVQANEALDQQINDLIAEGKEVPEDLIQEKTALPLRIKLAQMRAMLNELNRLDGERVKNYQKAGLSTDWQERARLYEESDRNGADAELARRNLIHMVRDIADELKDLLDEGRSKRSEMIKNEIEHRKKIISMGIDAVKKNPAWDPNIPVSEKEKSRQKSDRFINSLNATALSFNHMLKKIDVNHPGGEGPLYDYFMRGEHGAVASNNMHEDGMLEFGRRVDEKAIEIFGKTLKDVMKECRDVDDSVNIPIVRTETSNSGSKGDIIYTHLSKGQALYIWLTWRQDAGRVKLQRQGFNELSMDAIEGFIGEDMIKFGEWASDEFLVELREDKYSPTHERVFGAPLHKATHYFPIKIFGGSIADKDEIGERSPEGGIGSLAGNTVVRTQNSLPIDISTDAFEALLDYGSKMELWNATSELARDLNILRGSKAFRNYMEANHAGDFERFKQASQLAVGTYQADNGGDYSEFWGKIQSGFMQQAIGFRWYTALKQTLSYPAFWAYSSDLGFQARVHGYFFTPWINYKWAMDNLPSFRQRVAKGDMGVEGLNEKTFLDAITGKISKWGMSANKLVDALTVAAGSRAVFESDFAKYKKMGKSEAEARRLAIINAEICFNESQQSSRPEFSAPIQKNRDLLSRCFNAFQNSNISYRRAIIEGWMDVSRAGDMYKRGKIGKKEFSNTVWRGVRKIVTFAVILPGLWQFGIDPSIIFGQGGDDDDEWLEKKINWWIDMATAIIEGMFTNGINGGTFINSLIDYTKSKVVKKDSFVQEYDPLQGFKIMTDAVKDISKDVNNEDYFKIAKDVGLRTLQANGVNIETFNNIGLGVWDVIDNGDLELLDFMLVLNMAKSKRIEWVNRHYSDMSYDEIGDRMSRAMGNWPKYDDMDYDEQEKVDNRMK